MLRFSESRVPLLLIALVAQGFADNDYFICVCHVRMCSCHCEHFEFQYYVSQTIVHVSIFHINRRVQLSFQYYVS